MDLKKKVTISWSGGKDSALALYKLLTDDEYEVVNLHTIFDEGTRRVGLHGIHESLIEAQAEALGIPLVKWYLPSSQSHDEYEKLVLKRYSDMCHEGITHIAFGDIFLQDLKDYREDLAHQCGLTTVFPLWGMGSDTVLYDFFKAKFRTVVCAANNSCFNEGLLGKELTEQIVESLPNAIDCCGENGEFHSFVFDAPIFGRPVNLSLGNIVSKDYTYKVLSQGKEITQRSTFYFQDLYLKI